MTRRVGVNPLVQVLSVDALPVKDVGEEKGKIFEISGKECCAAKCCITDSAKMCIKGKGHLDQVRVGMNGKCVIEREIGMCIGECVHPCECFNQVGCHANTIVLVWFATCSDGFL